SRPRRASERRNIRSSSSVIWAATFSWLNPILSRSVTVGPLSGVADLALSASFFSSSKTPAALFALGLACARTGRAESNKVEAISRATPPATPRRNRVLRLPIENLLRSRLAGFLGSLKDILLHLNHFGYLIHNV